MNRKLDDNELRAHGMAPPKEPPHNLSAEAAIIGAILYDNNAYHRISHMLRESDFYAESHAEIFDACSDLIEAGHTADGVTLRQEFEDNERLKAVGGAAYLAELFDSAVVGPEVMDYSRLIVDLSMRRTLMNISAELGFQAEKFDRDKTTRDSLAEGIQKIEDLMLRSSTERDQWELAADAVEEEIGIVAENVESGRVLGMPCGISKLDEALGGFHKGDLYVIGGASSMGKTALAMNICTGLAQIGEKKVALFSQEMSREQLSWRLAAAQARRLGIGSVEYQKMRTGLLGMNEVAILREGMKSIPRRFAWNTAAGLTFQDVRASIRKARRKLGGLDVVCIDYLQIMNIRGTRDKTRAEAIGDVTMGLKNLAKTEGFTCLLLSQLSRLKGRDDKRPTLDDLRDSGSIEQDADAVIFAYRDEYYLKRKEPQHIGSAVWTEWKVEYDKSRGKFQALIAKQRMGPIGSVDLFFEMQTDVIVDDKALLTEEDLF